MCMLCLREDVFSVRNIDVSTIEKKKKRAAEIKKNLKDTEKNGGTCHVGDQLVDELKKEQFELSKHL